MDKHLIQEGVVNTRGCLPGQAPAVWAACGLNSAYLPCMHAYPLNYFKKRFACCLLVQVSLDSLMSTLRSTNVHYIRCIKPNSNCQPGIFDRKQVLFTLVYFFVISLTVNFSSASPRKNLLIDYQRILRKVFLLNYLLGPRRSLRFLVRADHPNDASKVLNL